MKKLIEIFIVFGFVWTIYYVGEMRNSSTEEPDSEEPDSEEPVLYKPISEVDILGEFRCLPSSAGIH